MPRTENKLAAAIIGAFLDVPKPNETSIAPHQCEECREICEAFAPFEFGELPGDVIALHYDSLPLLSPPALHHYLPAYLLYALEHPDSDVFEFTIYQLSPSKKLRQEIAGNHRDRIVRFTLEQRGVVLEFLRWASTTKEAVWFSEEFQAASEIWNAKA